MECGRGRNDKMAKKFATMEKAARKKSLCKQRGAQRDYKSMELNYESYGCGNESSVRFLFLSSADDNANLNRINKSSNQSNKK